MWNLIIFILLPVVVQTKFSPEKLLPKHDVFQGEYLKNLIGQFEEFHKIMHFEEVARNTLRYVSNFFVFIQQVTIYNYDFKKRNIQRPEGGKILNIVILRNLTYFEEFLGKLSNINGRDVVMVITINKVYGEKLPHNLKLKNIRAAGRYLLFNLINGTVEVYYVCLYCGTYEDRVILLQKAESSELTIPTKYLLPNTFNDFKGHEFSILFNQYFPYMHCLVYVPTKRDDKTFNKCLKWVGSEGELVEALADKMNFTYNLFALTEYITVPKMLPYLEKDDRFDFAIGGIALLYEDSKRISHSRLLGLEKVVLMYKRHVGWQARFLAFLNALSGKLWLLLDATLIVFATTLFIFVWILYGKKKLSIFFNIIRMLIKMMIDQPVTNKCIIKKMRIPVLILMLIWTFACIDFSVVYKSSLSSRIIHPPIEKYNDIFELTAMGYKIGMEDSHFNNLNTSFVLSEKSMEIFKRNIFRMNILCEGVEISLKQKIALAGEYSFLYHHCQQQLHYKLDYENEVNFARKPISSVLHGWIFKKGEPYIEAFNKFILMMQSCGLIDKWSEDTLRKKKTFIYRKDKSSHSGKLKDFVSHFTLYSIGMSLSVFVFVIELIYHRISAKISAKILITRKVNDKI